MTDRPVRLPEPPGAPPTTPAGEVAAVAAPGRADDAFSADPLSDVLRTVRLTGALFFQVRAGSPWVAEVPEAPLIAPILLPGAQQIVSFHIVTEGACCGALAGGPPVPLEAGDVVLFPHGDRYVLSSAPRMRSEDSRERTLAHFRELAARQPPVLALGSGATPDCQIVCGYLGCDVRPFNPLLAALPKMVRVRLPVDRADDRLGPLAEFALAEFRARRSGGQCVLLRLSEVMFVEVVRQHLAELSAEQTGWLAGLRDPVVGRALALLHSQPARPWTLDGLAREAGISRSTLVERFVHIVGQPPMQYLARWRMQLAARLLVEGATKVRAVALEVGYESEAAFSRAFKKIVGTPPAAWRRRASPGSMPPTAPAG